MDRITKWNGSKYILPQGRWRDIADRLGAYEDTGYEPEDIILMTFGENVEKSKTFKIADISKADIVGALTTFKNMADERYKSVFDAAIIAVNEYGER